MQENTLRPKKVETHSEKEKRRNQKKTTRDVRRERDTTDETLTTVLLLSHERGHTGQSRVTESTCKVGHHTVPRKEVRKSQESCTVPVYVLSVNTLPRARARLSSNTSIRNKTCVGLVS